MRKSKVGNHLFCHLLVSFSPESSNPLIWHKVIINTRVLKYELESGWHGGIFKTQIARAHHQKMSLRWILVIHLLWSCSERGSLRWVSIMFRSNKFPGDATAGGPGTTRCEPFYLCFLTSHLLPPSLPISFTLSSLPLPSLFLLSPSFSSFGRTTEWIFRFNLL